MKKAIVFALALLSAKGSFAQPNAKNSTEYHKPAITFEHPQSQTHIRDLVQLKNFNYVLFELSRVSDYDMLKDLDLLITRFNKDIAFYKDSLDNISSGNVRIDYAIWIDSSMHDLDDRAEIRFKKYPPDGDTYINKKGNVARLKMNQDTVNFIIRVSPNTPYAQLHYTPSVQVSFFLNNYADISRIAEDRELLNHAIDTLQSTKRRSTITDPAKFPSTTIYRPYVVNNGSYRFSKYWGITKREDLDNPNRAIKRSDNLSITLNMGMGLVRNTFAPTAEAAIAISTFRPVFNKGEQDQEINSYFALSMTPYFLFDRDETTRNFYVSDNWFANFEVGGATNFMGIKTPLLTGGIGYLAFRNGDYFKGTTMKAFMSVKLKKSLTIGPEVIFTENFKQIFPGFTIKFL